MNEGRPEVHHSLSDTNQTPSTVIKGDGLRFSQRVLPCFFTLFSSDPQLPIHGYNLTLLPFFLPPSAPSPGSTMRLLLLSRFSRV